MSNTINHDREAIAQKIAYIMLKGFDKHYRLFQNISASAQERFNARQWKEISQANVDRIVMYDKRVKETSAELLQYLSDTIETDALWVQVKRIYIGLLYEHKQPELAETFYNSVACRVLARDYYHNRYIFFRPAMNTDFLKGARRTFNS
jgi:isocitrate dehydrogenase kinase/phosphatase